MEDPGFITTQHWSTIAKYLHSMWLYLLVIIGFAMAFLMAHAVAPSLLATKEIRPEAQRVRPILYLVSLITLALAAFFLASSVNLARIVETFYRRWWI